MKVKILNRKIRWLLFSSLSEWHAVASWTWDAHDDACGICRMAFDGCCPDCKMPGDDCPLKAEDASGKKGSPQRGSFSIFEVTEGIRLTPVTGGTSEFECINHVGLSRLKVHFQDTFISAVFRRVPCSLSSVRDCLFNS
ncbi:hypothetical protein R1flu_021739 [Riccia fluitans]|uniref:Anaphase-promoting complex subunit 11 RING-H2 finger domain-containing protein n=1 Tax=Riccia fluitans TaxID=41844 RepID=A0ABD1ZQ86_9MARC